MLSKKWYVHTLGLGYNFSVLSINHSYCKAIMYGMEVFNEGFQALIGVSIDIRDLRFNLVILSNLYSDTILLLFRVGLMKNKSLMLYA